MSDGARLDLDAQLLLTGARRQRSLDLPVTLCDIHECMTLRAQTLPSSIHMPTPVPFLSSPGIVELWCNAY